MVKNLPFWKGQWNLSYQSLRGDIEANEYPIQMKLHYHRIIGSVNLFHTFMPTLSSAMKKKSLFQPLNHLMLCHTHFGICFGCPFKQRSPQLKRCLFWHAQYIIPSFIIIFRSSQLDNKNPYLLAILMLFFNQKIHTSMFFFFKKKNEQTFEKIPSDQV